jgi:hypothetical protein
VCNCVALAYRVSRLAHDALDSSGGAMRNAHNAPL